MKDAWNEDITDNHEFYPESEDPDENDERLGPCVSIWRNGGDGTFIEVYGTDILEARKLAKRVLDSLNEL